MSVPTARDWDTDPWCLNGWPGCDGNYTGGHYCRKDHQHSGRCVCADCGATTTTAPPTEEVTGE